MHKFSGKVIQVKRKHQQSDQLHLGLRLRELRQLAGMTQCEVAHKLAIGQTALSRMERRSDIHVSTLKNYINALGASLRIDATFENTSSLALNIEDAFDLRLLDDNQLTLPVFEDENFKAQRDVILSIKPRYSEPIIAGVKTVELRRRFPLNVPKGTVAYIYSTSPTRALIGSAEIAGVLKRPIQKIWKDYSKTAYIGKADFEKYFTGLEVGFVIQFQNARPLRRPLSLEELRDRFHFEPPQSFLYAKPLLREALKYESATISN